VRYLEQTVAFGYFVGNDFTFGVIAGSDRSFGSGFQDWLRIADNFTADNRGDLSSSFSLKSILLLIAGA
jgi:hypothetical protein